MSAIEYLVIMSVSGAAILFWAMNVWGGWAEKFYERYKYSYWYWYWLRLGGVTPSRKNCVRFVKAVSMFAILFVSAGAVVATHEFLRTGG